MKVVHVSTSLTGGAAIAARRLHDSLAPHGVESTFWFTYGTPPEDPTYLAYSSGPSALSRRIWTQLRRLRALPYLAGRERKHDAFSDSGWLLPMSPRTLRLQPDIFHLHWTADFLNYSTFFAALPPGTPVVWTLHDMHPFTGGCHYSFDCERFTAACGECPQLNRLRSPADLSRQNLRLKRETLRERNVHVVADSHWLEAQARRSAVFATAGSFRTVHYGLDTAAYAPKPKAECRRALGLPQEAFVVCFGSQSLADPRKGLPELLAALRRLHDQPGLVGLVFGADLPPLDKAGLPPIHSAGFLSGAAAQATMYSAADVFVIPSLAEAFGQTALEAMACGTPVVGFDTGGIPDTVRPHQTGLLVPVGDDAALADAIRWMMTHRTEREAMGRNARAMVEADFTLERQALGYLQLYRSVLDA